MTCPTLGWFLVCVGAQLMEWGDALLPPVDHAPQTHADRQWREVVYRAASELLDEEEAEREAVAAARRAEIAAAAALTHYPLAD